MYIGALPKNGETTDFPNIPLTWGPHPSSNVLIVFSLADSSLSNQEAPIPILLTSAQLDDLMTSPKAQIACHHAPGLQPLQPHPPTPTPVLGPTPPSAC